MGLVASVDVDVSAYTFCNTIYAHTHISIFIPVIFPLYSTIANGSVYIAKSVRVKIMKLVQANGGNVLGVGTFCVAARARELDAR